MGIPNRHRAVTNTRIVTVKNGQRLVRQYKSGEPLDGTIPENDAPPFTGYVRNWFRKEGRNGKSQQPT